MVPARFCPIDEIKFRHFDWRTKKRYQGWAPKEIWIGELKLRFKAALLQIWVHSEKHGGCICIIHRCVRAPDLFPFHWNVLFAPCTQISNSTRQPPCKALPIPERGQKGRLALRGFLKTTIWLCLSSKSRNLYRQLGQTWQFIIIAITVFTVRSMILMMIITIMMIFALSNPIISPDSYSPSVWPDYHHGRCHVHWTGNQNLEIFYQSIHPQLLKISMHLNSLQSIFNFLDNTVLHICLVCAYYQSRWFFVFMS